MRKFKIKLPQNIKKYVIQENIFRLRRQRDRLLYGEVNQVERTKFIKACPSPECRGFLSSQWKCGICQNFTCPDCHEVKGPNRECDHVCDENARATAMLLANDTKSCPNCGVGIYKIEDVTKCGVLNVTRHLVGIQEELRIIFIISLL